MAWLKGLGFAVVDLWVNGAQTDFDAGKMVFMSPCTSGGSVEATTYLDTHNLSSCEQRVTTNAPIGAHGTSMTVSPSYQMGYSSLPFQASGKLGGAMLRAQFTKPTNELPDYLIIASYNEAIAQPQPNNNYKGANSMGVYDHGDTTGRSPAAPSRCPCTLTHSLTHTLTHSRTHSHVHTHSHTHALTHSP